MPRISGRHPSVAVVAMLLGAAGCSRSPARIEVPAVAAGAAADAVAQYDANKDGALDDAELKNVPSLRTRLTDLDQNRDGKVDAPEIDARIAAWKASGVGLLPMTIRVSARSQPIADAEVTIEPEAFLGSALKPARGKTNQDGIAVMQISNDPRERGVQSGFYRVRISKLSNGTETIPARYNQASELGIEVEPSSPSSRDVSFALLP